MKKFSKISSLLFLLVMFASAAANAQNNSFYLKPMTSFEPGTQDVIELMFDNTDTFYGFSADITLPKGLEFVLKEDGKADVSLNSDRFANTYQLVTNIKDGKLLMGSFSADPTQSIKGSSGVLVYIKVKVADDYHQGNLTISNIKFINANDRDVPLLQQSSPILVLPTSITLNHLGLGLQVKDGVSEEAKLSVIFTPDYTTNRIFTWSSSDTNVATIDEDGTVKAVYKGVTEITATTINGKKATCYVSVGIPVTSVEMEPTTASIEVRDALTIKATPLPMDADNREFVQWYSSDETVATVDNQGNVTPLKVGEVTITAQCGSATGTSTVTVIPTLAESVTVSPSSVELLIGEKTSLTATVLPDDTTDKTVVWSSSDESVATVSEDGEVTAINRGTATITATTANGKTDTSTVMVLIHARGLTLDRAEMTMEKGSTETLIATPDPIDTTDPITWVSSDESIATVIDGVVTAVSVGDAVITAKCGDYEASCKVTVIITAKGLTLDKSEMTMEKGSTETLIATPDPIDTTDPITWESSDETIATVENGVVKAVGVGEAVITAKCSTYEATCDVTVIISPKEIKLDPESVDLYVGETVSIVATILPDDATDKTVTWTSSDEKIATVSADGVVTAVSKGAAVITATTYNGKEAVCNVTVLLPATGITLDKSEMIMEKGSTETLIATPEPIDTTDPIIWSSSDESIVTVENGVVTAVNVGNAVISAKCGTYEAICKVTVIISPKDIKLEPETVDMYVGGTTTLSATVLPEDATDQSKIWTSSDETVATVDASGLVIAKSLGTTAITVACGTLSATSVVNVIPTPAESIIIDPESAELKVGERVFLTATVLPQDATDKTVTWSSSDENIATIDASGLVIAKAVGEVTITATCGDVTATAKVTVKPIPVTGLTLTNTALLMRVGYTSELGTLIEPFDATDKSVVWTTADPSIATVDQNGLVTAIAVGQTVITATSVSNPEVKAVCYVTVEPNIIAVTNISLNESTLDMIEGDKFELIATLTPEDVTDKTVTWTTSDASVATVSETGVVTAIKPGVVEIMASSSNGLTATCIVTVSARIIEATGLRLSNSELSLIEGETADLIPIISPEDATDKSVVWTSDNPEIATVDANGIVTAVKQGFATITAMTKNGLTATCAVTVNPRIIAVEGISLNRTELELVEEDTFELIATITPENATDKTVTWKTSDPSIATVSETGVVTAVHAGVAVIYASSSNGLTAECAVTVKPGVIPVENVDITNNELTLYEGEVANLIAIVSPDNATDKSVTWSSEDVSIATVDQEGNVTAVKVGVTKVKATSVNGKFDECIVNVIPNIVVVNGITLNKSELELTEGDTFELIATITPENATDKTVTWKSSDPAIATVDEKGVVTAVSAGVATIYASSSNGLTAECVVTVKRGVVEVTGISLTNTELTLIEGDTSELYAIIRPADATDQSVTWSTEDGEIATVDDKGIVTAIKAGVTKITAKSANGLTAICTVTVLPRIIDVTGITLNPTTLELEEGETFTLEATITPENATDKTITWRSSDRAIATVDENGVVTAVSAGVATIYASSSNGLTAECAVTVKRGIVEVTGISLTNTELTLIEGDTSELYAIIRPADATDQSVTWSTEDGEIATVDDKGLVTAIKAGVTKVIAKSANGMTAICMVTVLPRIIDVTGITLNPTTLELEEGETFTLEATITPENATDKTITWRSSDRAIATVDENGVVTAVSAGVATIYASSSNGLTAECAVTVKRGIVEVTGISLTNTELTLIEGDTSELYAIIRPADATDQSVTWSTEDGEIATVDDKGLVTAIKAGVTKVIAKSANGMTAICMVTVLPRIIDVTGITLNPTTLELEEGETFTLEATITPDNATDKTVTWRSSDRAIATVDDNGEVTAVSAGVATIYASSSNGLTAECAVTVKRGFVPVTRISLSNTELLMKVDESTSISAIVHPYDATDPSVVWSSNDESIVIVDQQGNITSKKVGVAIVTVTSVSNPAIKAECKVTVETNIVDVTGITLNPTTLELEEGDKFTLTATITPDNATDKTVTWRSSDRAIATVDDNGEVTAVSAGVATIYASSSNGLTAECVVTVKRGIVEVTGISLSNTELTLIEGDTSELLAIIRPADATDQSVTWSTEDGEIATVDDKGLITAIKVGVTKITATSANGMTAICTVTVLPRIYDVTGITLNPTTLELEEGEKFTLKATITPDNATDKTVTWRSSDRAIATVDENGEVTAVSAGVATIYASSSNGLTAECAVSVKRGIVEVTGISLSNSELTLIEGDTSELFAIIRPADATDQSVTWSTEDGEIATVDDNGLVTAIKAGVTKITAKSANGMTAICTVTVLPRIYDVTGITLNPTTLELEEGDKFTLNATITPDNATDKTVTWRSSDRAIATVDENGEVTAVSAGVATIYASSSNGLTAECVVTVKRGIVEVTGISLSNSELTLIEGDTSELFAIIRPADATDQSVTWSTEDGEIATVDDKGLVTAIKVGVTKITAKSANGMTAICTVTVLPRIYDVTGITLNPTTLELEEGDKFTLTATIAPDNATDKTVTWRSSDRAIATVDEKGEVTAVSAGVATIYASSSNGLTAECVVTVKRGVVDVIGISLSNTELTLTEGETAEIFAIIHPSDATDQRVSWSSENAQIAMVDDKGVITAVKQGIVKVIATSVANPDVKGICTVTVEPAFIPVAGIKLNEHSKTITVEDTFTLIATITPDDATDKTVTWKTSDATIATVDANGLVTGVAVGQATIYASSSNGLTDECIVTVEPGIVPVTGISLSNTELLMREGHTSDLFAIVEPFDATDPSVTWTSDDANIAAVDVNGMVTAIKTGFATITATTSNGLKATCAVTVIPDIIPATGITLNKTQLNLIEGDTFTLIATITPENATDKTVTWMSTNRSIATVSDGGVVTAISAGTATIYASTSNGLTAICEVTVEPLVIEVSTVALSALDLTLWEGQSDTLEAFILPENATDKTVTWTSNNPEIASVVDGVVTGVRAGTATIMVKSANGRTAYCAVTVKGRPLTPKQLLRKGDGTSCTFVIMMSLPDAELTKLGYKFVTGYTDPSGASKIIADTPLRYSHTTSEIYNNKTYDFWTFAYVENEDGEIATSNLRHLDGSEEVCFDPSIYGFNPGSRGGSSNGEDWVTVTPSSLVISIDSDSDSELGVYTVSGIKVYSKSYSGSTHVNDVIDINKFTPGNYVVTLNCSGNVKAKKILVQ